MRVSDLPLICTLYERIQDTTPYKNRPMQRDKGQTAFNSVCKLFRLHTRNDESLHKKVYDVRTKELVRNIEEESRTEENVYYRQQLHNHTENYDQYKRDSENRFDQSSRELLTALNFFVLNEDNCLSLGMICRKKQEMIFSIPSLKSTHTHLFRGLDYSGLSVHLKMLGAYEKTDNTILMDFIRPDTYFGCNKLSFETSYISNTVNRNIFTRYNDQILMGFLINHYKFPCNIEYDVKVSIVKFEGDDRKFVTDEEQNNISEIYLYEIPMKVEASDVQRNEIRGYRMIISKIIMEYRIDNGKLFLSSFQQNAPSALLVHCFLDCISCAMRQYPCVRQS